MKLRISIEGLLRRVSEQTGLFQSETHPETPAPAVSMEVDSDDARIVLAQVETFVLGHVRAQAGDTLGFPDAEGLTRELAASDELLRDAERKSKNLERECRKVELVRDEITKARDHLAEQLEETNRNALEALAIARELQSTFAGSGIRWPNGLRKRLDEVSKKLGA